MEVVINSCYGGFSISPVAVKRMAELNGKKTYFFEGGIGKDYKPITLTEAIKNRFIWYAFSIPNPNDYLKSNDWNEMTEKEKAKHNKLYDKYILSTRDYDRADKKLIQVVKELGKKSWGDCAELTIVKIPNGIKWHVEEYDGNEHIAEDHRIWS